MVSGKMGEEVYIKIQHYDWPEALRLFKKLKGAIIATVLAI